MEYLRTSCFICLLLGSVLLVSGCVSTESQAGVENNWQNQIDSFIPRETTQADVLELLGPPSQIIALHGREVFYYLKEVAKRKGTILIVYNKLDETVHYERAVFFFDEDGLLEQFSISKNES